MTNTYASIDLERTGRRLRELMHMKNVTVREVALLLGVSNQTVYKWLKGRSLPTLENAFQLSLILHTKIDNIIVTGEVIEYEMPCYLREEVLPYSCAGGIRH